VRGELRPDHAVIVDTERERSTTWKYHDEVIAPALMSAGVEMARVPKSQFATVDLWGGRNKNTLLIPAFTTQGGDIGKLSSFCSGEWKRDVIRRWARRTLGLRRATMWLGISVDELRRAKPGRGPWRNRFPLIERGMNRGDCQWLIAKMGWPDPPRSSCWMCPNHLQAEWRDVRSDPDDWRKAVTFDRYIRTKDPHAYLHADAVPLDQADLDERNASMFQHCDSGLCFV
jgi:hypothetical protein